MHRIDRDKLRTFVQRRLAVRDFVRHRQPEVLEAAKNAGTDAHAAAIAELLDLPGA